MFLGAFVPGLVLVGLYACYLYFDLALISQKLLLLFLMMEKLIKTFGLKKFLTLVPPLTLIVIVLGSIISGIATVNQAGAIGGRSYSRWYMNFIHLQKVLFILHYF